MESSAHLSQGASRGHSAARQGARTRMGRVASSSCSLWLTGVTADFYRQCKSLGLGTPFAMHAGQQIGHIMHHHGEDALLLAGLASVRAHYWFLFHRWLGLHPHAVCNLPSSAAPSPTFWGHSGSWQQLVMHAESSPMHHPPHVLPIHGKLWTSQLGAGLGAAGGGGPSHWGAVAAFEGSTGRRQAWPAVPRCPPLAPPPPPARLCPAYLFTLTRRRSLLAALCRTDR